MKTICSNDARQFINQLKDCDDGFCGTYKGLRRNKQYVEAVDLSCNEGNAVYAPFDGEISYYQPFGQKKQLNWRGYYALISTVKLLKYGGKVTAGEKLGVAGNLDCFTSVRRSSSQNFVRVQLFRQGNPIDPTHHLIDCIRYNGVRGWELRCPVSGANEQSISSEEDELRAPQIYSPIDGNIIGRVRLDYSTGTYAGCGNEGLFIVGNGKWEDYEIRIYNVRFREDLGLGQNALNRANNRYC
uniref:Peptidase M23 domain-containing protein n=1 Tax=Ditylenchus dipsaci TaxID=166011 RepID=A0A915DFS9_9BILA